MPLQLQQRPGPTNGRGALRPAPVFLQNISCSVHVHQLAEHRRPHIRI